VIIYLCSFKTHLSILTGRSVMEEILLDTYQDGHHLNIQPKPVQDAKQRIQNREYQMKYYQHRAPHCIKDDTPKTKP